MEEGAAIIELTKAIDGKISARPWVPLTTIIGVTRKVDARLFYVVIAAMNAIFAMAELMVQTIWDSHFHFVVFSSFKFSFDWTLVSQSTHGISNEIHTVFPSCLHSVI